MGIDFTPIHTGLADDDDLGDEGHVVTLKLNASVASLRAAIDAMLGITWTTQNSSATAAIATKYLADAHSGFALTMPAAFTADTTAASDIWVANKDDASNVTLTPASGDKFYLSNVDQGTDTTIALVPGKLAIIRPRTTNSEWDVFIMAADAASSALRSIIAGVPRVYRKTINYNDANITTGIDIYTPAVGDVLHDAWIEILTPWNGGSGNHGDIGQFVAGNYGFYGLGAYNGTPYLDYGWEMGGMDDGNTPYIGSSGTYENASLAASVGTYNGITVPIPVVFTSTASVKFVATQNGQKGGSDCSASQGQARIYVVVSSPIDV